MRTVDVRAMFRKNPRKRSAYLLLVLSVLCGLRAEAQQRGTIGWNRWRWGPAGVWTWDAACVLGRQRAAKSVGTVGLRAAIGSEGTWQGNAMMGGATGKDWTAHSGVRWGPKHVVTWRLDALFPERGWFRVEVPLLQPSGVPLVTAWQIGLQKKAASDTWFQAALAWKQSSRLHLSLQVRQSRMGLGVGSGGVLAIHSWSGHRGVLQLAIGWMRRQIPWGGVSAGRLDPWWGGDDPLVTHGMRTSLP